MSENSRQIQLGHLRLRSRRGQSGKEKPMTLRSTLLAILASLALSPAAVAAPPSSSNENLALVNRLSWGETAQGDTLGGLSAQDWLQRQLHPGEDDGLPPEIQARIAAMDISQHSPARL